MIIHTLNNEIDTIQLQFTPLDKTTRLNLWSAFMAMVYLIIFLSLL